MLAENIPILNEFDNSRGLMEHLFFLLLFFFKFAKFQYLEVARLNLADEMKAFITVSCGSCLLVCGFVCRGKIIAI